MSLQKRADHVRAQRCGWFPPSNAVAEFSFSAILRWHSALRSYASMRCLPAPPLERLQFIRPSNANPKPKRRKLAGSGIGQQRRDVRLAAKMLRRALSSHYPEGRPDVRSLAFRSALSEVSARCPLNTIEFALPAGRLTVGSRRHYRLTE